MAKKNNTIDKKDSQPIALIYTDTHLSNDNLEQNKNIHQQILEIAVKYNFTSVFCLGDDFESRKSQTLPVLQAYQDVLDMFKEYGITKVIIPGNHCKMSLISEDSYLDIFRTHSAMKLYRSYQYFVWKHTGDGYSIIFHVIPYFLEEEKYFEYLQQAIDKIEENEKEGIKSKNILLTHIAINGVKNNDGSEVKNFLDKDIFNCFDLVLCGHYHARSKIGQKINYIGSVAPKNFGEDAEKGVCILYDDLHLEYIKLDFPEFKTIKVNIDNENSESLDKLLKQHLNSKDHIRFSFSGDSAKLDALDQNKFKAHGISVEIKKGEIERGIELVTKGEIISFNKSNIVEEFEKFCAKEEIQNMDKGMEYLKKQLIGG